MEIVGDVVYAALVGLIGFGVYRAVGAGLSRSGRRVVVGLVIAAMAFSLSIVTWEIAKGTATSSQGLIVFIAGIPLGLAIVAVALIDGVVGNRRRHP